ncbi:MAG: ketoacyl-ACP synthase III [Bacteroidota bacterium]
MNAFIRSIEYYLPEQVVTNADLQAEFPHWDVDKVEKKTGVRERHIAAKKETALDLSIKACEKLFAQYDKDAIDGIIYCTQSPDYIMPSNSFLLQKHFGLSEKAFAFDFNHACTGYIYGLMMAQSFIRSEMASRLLLINADTYSKYINPQDRSTRVLFGDAAAASIMEGTTEAIGVIDMEIATYGEGYDKFMIPAGGTRLPLSGETAKEVKDDAGNVKSQQDIHMDGLAVWSFINSKVPGQIDILLKRNGLQMKDIDLVIFHQASMLTIDSLVKKLKLDTNKVFINIQNIGNTVSASIPIAVKDAMDSGRLQKGNKMLLSGFGVGLAYGTVLIQM